MRLDDDFDGGEERNSIFLKALTGISLTILLILIVVLVANKDRLEEKAEERQKSLFEANVDEERLNEKKYVESLVSGNEITSQDLEFWSLYDGHQESVSESDSIKVEESSLKESLSSDAKTKESRVLESDVLEESETVSYETDGKHTRIVYQDGSDEWIEINRYLTKNTYDVSNLVLKKNIMGYYVNSENKSFVGASLSKADGEINFYQLKREGIQYCILRIGQRGYQKGEIALDTQFEENLKGCIETEMPFGISFSSQAKTEEEAREEAQFVIDQLKAFHERYEFTLKYPIVLCLEPVLTDSSRNKDLDRNDRTIIAEAFLKKIKEAGFEPMLYANKEWLIKKLYLSHLAGYDVWLDQTGDVFDYPYQFVMWHYSNTAVVNGADNAINLSISFVDYSMR